MEIISDNLKKYFKNNEDFTQREIKINNISVTIFYIDGLINSTAASDYIIKPLFQENIFKNSQNEKDLIYAITDGHIYFANQKTRWEFDDVVNDIISGSVALVFDYSKTAITFDIKGFDKRSVSESTSENVIKGSKEAFVESIRVNTTLIRRRIKSGDLKIENMVIGKRTKTNFDIIYIESLTNNDLIKQLKQKLSSISIDSMLSVANIEEYLNDSKISLFPTIQNTELPDKFCSNILEGYVGFIVDGIPMGFIYPTTLNQCMQAPEDYSQNYIFNSTIRILRYLLLVLTLTLPGFYISVTTYHHELLPTEIVQFISGAKEGVPFPSIVEVIFMLLAFEILIEAALRLPKTIGQAVSIVGGVIIGQAAVSAKLVSPSIVVIISITAIAGFVLPNQDLSNAIRIWRFIIVFFSSIMGLFGLTLGMLVLLAHLSNIENSGVSFLSPFVDRDDKTLKESFIRARMTEQKIRPQNINPKDSVRRVS